MVHTKEEHSAPELFDTILHEIMENLDDFILQAIVDITRGMQK